MKPCSCRRSSTPSTSTTSTSPAPLRCEGDTFINYVTDIGRSLAHHGFRKILLVNGHGSNVPFLDIVARNITNRDAGDLRHGAPGGAWRRSPCSKSSGNRSSPAGWRTAASWRRPCCSIFAAIWCRWTRPRATPVQRSEFFYWDLQTPSPVFFQEFFSRYSRTGTLGDPTKASLRKGELFVAGVVETMIRLIRELRAREIADRVDHH